MIIESFMDNLYFGSGTQDHLSTFRKWDFLKESAKAQESHHYFILWDSLERNLAKQVLRKVPFPKSLKKQLVSRFFVTFFALFY